MKKRILAIATILILLGFGIWAGFQYDFQFNLGGKKAAEDSLYSGTIEATMVPIQPEQGGKLNEVLVQEGQAVKAGDVLARMDNRSAKITLESAKAQVAAAQASLDQALAGFTEPTVVAQKAVVDIAKQSVKAAELVLEKFEIKSLLDGRVFYRHVEAGQVVSAGTRIVTLQNPEDLWVRVYVPETEFKQVKLGGAVRVTKIGILFSCT